MGRRAVYVRGSASSSRSSSSRSASEDAGRGLTSKEQADFKEVLKNLTVRRNDVRSCVVSLTTASPPLHNPHVSVAFLSCYDISLARSRSGCHLGVPRVSSLCGFLLPSPMHGHDRACADQGGDGLRAGPRGVCGRGRRDHLWKPAKRCDARPDQGALSPSQHFLASLTRIHRLAQPLAPPTPSTNTITTAAHVATAGLITPARWHLQVARLYLVSDILHNSGASVKNASAYRSEFQVIYRAVDR